MTNIERKHEYFVRMSFKQTVEGSCVAVSEEDARKRIEDIYGEASMFLIESIEDKGVIPEQLELALAEPVSKAIN